MSSHFNLQVSKAESTEYLRTHRPTATLDVAAANRFINHAIPDLTNDQRARIRAAEATIKASDAAAAGASGKGRDGGSRPRAGLGFASSSKRQASAGEAVSQEAKTVAGTGGSASKKQRRNGGKQSMGTARDAAVNFLDQINESACETAQPQANAPVDSD